ncbi:MAG: hypothetical protein K2V38_03835 [Gemmataceae bacterium]|nr:hypothetical protein [Gemmataceae bacterium]
MADVSYRAEVLSKLRDWGRVAVRVGMRDEFLAAVREMEDRLQAAPESWGDPVRTHRGLKLTEYQRYGPIFIVVYHVYAGGNPVFAWDVRLTPNSLLADLLD